jgi:hypothetical protein
MLMVYVPLVGNVCVVKLNPLLLEDDDVSEVPSGFRSLTAVVLIVLPVMRTVTC